MASDLLNVQPNRLPEMVARASQALAAASNAAEVLEARDVAALAYDAAKAAARFARAKGAHDELIAAAHRAQADALEIEAQAKRRLADEYDAAQQRGEVAAQSTGRPVSVIGSDTSPAKLVDLGLTRQQVHEARQIRDAEVSDPGLIRRTLDQRLEQRQEPTKAAVREAVANVVSLGDRQKPIKSFSEVEREGLALAAAEEAALAPEVDLDSLHGRAHAFNGALSTLDLIAITGREYWSMFGSDPAKQTYESWVRSAHAKLTNILKEIENGLHGSQPGQVRRDGKGRGRKAS